MKNYIVFLLLFFVTILLVPLSGCDVPIKTPKTDSGVTKATAEVKIGVDGLTGEQRNCVRRLKEDNLPGAIKHLYVISPESGQVLFYSTVAGKVSSSGKRLQPKTVIGDFTGVNNTSAYFNIVTIGGENYATNEMIQDDGTLGDSDPYIYWWDVRGVYHQHFMTGGQILHVSSVPLSGIKSIVINIEEGK